jgi:rRNA maturation protein Rpf1
MMTALFTNNLCRVMNWTGTNGRGYNNDESDKEDNNADDLAFIVNEAHKVPFKKLKCWHAIHSEYE